MIIISVAAARLLPTRAAAAGLPENNPAVYLPTRNQPRSVDIGYNAALRACRKYDWWTILLSPHTLEHGRNPPPSDYYENISVSVLAPWRIQASKFDYKNNVRLNWKRINDTRFEAGSSPVNPRSYLYRGLFDHRQPPRLKPRSSTSSGTLESKICAAYTPDIRFSDNAA
jgi:hypothetical protein